MLSSALAAQDQGPGPELLAVDDVSEDLDHAVLAHLDGKLQLPVEVKRHRVSDGQGLKPIRLEAYYPVGVLLGQTGVLCGGEREVRHVLSVQIEDHKGEVVGPSLLGYRRSNKQAWSFEMDQHMFSLRRRCSEPLRSLGVAYARGAGSDFCRFNFHNFILQKLMISRNCLS